MHGCCGKSYMAGGLTGRHGPRGCGGLDYYGIYTKYSVACGTNPISLVKGVGDKLR